MSNLEERSDELDAQMAAHPAEKSIAVLIRDANRRKRQLRILTASIVFDIVLSIALGVVTFKTNELAKLAQSNSDAVVANCEVSNESRRDEKALWDFVFALPVLEPPTAEEQARAAQFKAFINKTFAERDCQTEIKKTAPDPSVL